MLATAELIQEAVARRQSAELVPKWLAEVPLYRHVKSSGTVPVPSAALNSLSDLPLITKVDIRRNFPRNFLKNESELEQMLEAGILELEHTAGTSEERTSLLLPLGWWAEQEQRALRLNPLINSVLDQNPRARRVSITSPVCSGDICYTGTPSRNDCIVGDSLFANLSRCPFLWSETEAARMARETMDWQPVFLDVDPVYGVAFARYCEQHGIRLPSLKFIICSYEFVSVVHRQVLERVFRVPVLNLYGSTETGHLMMEHPLRFGGESRSLDMQGSYETAFLELLNADEQGIGDLVVTTLTNPYMPLIRYSIGDLAEQQEAPFGTRYRVHGRAADAFRTAGGKRVTTWQIDQCFTGLGGFAHYQLAQAKDEWKLRYIVDGSGPTPEGVTELQNRLLQLLRDGARLVIEPTDLLMPENSGKFRLGYPMASTRR